MTTTLNLTRELARLLSYTADVAIAIRLNSPYSGQYDLRNPQHGYDVLWLADSLHNFDSLGNAIQEGNPSNIASACDRLLQIYQMYTEGSFGSVKGDPKAAFERASNCFLLKDGMSIFLDIRTKVTPFVS